MRNRAKAKVAALYRSLVIHDNGNVVIHLNFCRSCLCKLSNDIENVEFSQFLSIGGLDFFKAADVDAPFAAIRIKKTRSPY